MSEITNRGTQRFWGILAHSLRREIFKASTLGWATKKTFAFNIDHTEKSDVFKRAMQAIILHTALCFIRIIIFSYDVNCHLVTFWMKYSNLLTLIPLQFQLWRFSPEKIMISRSAESAFKSLWRIFAL